MMQVYTIETPSGRKLKIEAPDQETAIRGAQEWEASQGEQQPAPVQDTPAEQPSTVADMVRGFGTGLREGVEGIVSTAGNFNRMGGDAAEWVAGAVGVSPETASKTGNFVRRMSVFGGMPTSEETRTQTQELIGDGLTYEPQTTAGKYARTTGQFVPSAAFGGGGLLQRGAQVVVPAVASETAGQMTEGSAAEPYARAAGALAGGIAAGRLSRPSTPAQRLPSAAEIKQSAGYEALKPTMQAARINQGTYQGVVRDLRNVADDFGMVPEQHGAFQRILADTGKRAARDGATMQDLEILRRRLQNAGQSTTNASSRALAARMVEKLDETVDRFNGGNLATQEGRTISQTLGDLRQARSTWRTGMKAEMIEAAQERAQNAASGFENGLRVEFRRILNNKTLSRMFSETEKQAMQQVVRGTFKGNLLRFLGTFGYPIDQGRNWLGAVAGGGVGGSVGAAVGGPVGAAIGGAAVPALGTAARMGANNVTRNQAMFVEALVKGGPQANKIAREALLELQAARNSGLLRTGTQMLTAARPAGQPQPVSQ